MVRYLLIGLGVIAALTATMFVVGSMTPQEYEVSRTLMLHQQPEVVWAQITDFESAPLWRPELEEIERYQAEDGSEMLHESGPGWEMLFVIDEMVPNERLVITIADDSLPYGGNWIYEFEAANGGTALTITEDGYVQPPLFRFLGTYVIGLEATVTGYLTNLAHHFGEDPEFIQ